jgi:hypothetical protein
VLPVGHQIGAATPAGTMQQLVLHLFEVTVARHVTALHLAHGSRILLMAAEQGPHVLFEATVARHVTALHLAHGTRILLMAAEQGPHVLFAALHLAHRLVWGEQAPAANQLRDEPVDQALRLRGPGAACTAMLHGVGN